MIENCRILTIIQHSNFQGYKVPFPVDLHMNAKNVFMLRALLELMILDGGTRDQSGHQMADLYSQDNIANLEGALTQWRRQSSGYARHRGNCNKNRFETVPELKKAAQKVNLFAQRLNPFKQKCQKSLLNI